MNISILTVFPELYESFLKTSLVGRAAESGHVTFHCSSFFHYSPPKKRIDAPIFGPGSGMLIKPEIVDKAIDNQEQSLGKAFKIFFSPHGKKIDQTVLHTIAQRAQEQKHVMLIAGRYEGMDNRVEEYYADMILSVGDFVLMGGDLPAMMTIEGFLRLIPGIVGKEESVQSDSFESPFVDYPAYTEPVVWKGMEVPAILRSGDHAKILQWRSGKAIERTLLGHFDWLRSHISSEKDKKAVVEKMPNHYAALMHTDVLLPDSVKGTTSVTSMDIHDIARSAKTYGLKNYFIVTPLHDQQQVVKTLLDFWQSDVGIDYNRHRHESVALVRMHNNLDEVIEAITKKENKPPLLIGTSAREIDSTKLISFFEQGKVWKEQRPVLFLFGTGKGLAPELLERCDYILMPIEGFTDFNHLSVRSAAAIIFDRWFGINKTK